MLFDFSREVISSHTDYLEPISYSIQKEHLDGPMFEALKPSSFGMGDIITHALGLRIPILSRPHTIVILVIHFVNKNLESDWEAGTHLRRL